MAWQCPDPEERLEEAIDLFHTGRVSGAETALRQLETMGYRCADVWLYLGHCALAGDRMREAIGHYRAARRAGSERAEACIGLAIIAARRLHFSRAVRLLERAARIQPDLQEAYDNLILCHAATGDTAAAEAAYRQSLRIDATSPHAHYNAGFLYFDTGQADKARVLWLRVLDAEPEYPDAERLVASCDRVLGKLGAARRRLEALLRRDPRNVEAMADLGLVHEDRDEWQSAVHAYERLLEVDPAHARARARLGVLLYRNGRQADGLCHVRRAAAEDPTDPEIAEPLAYALLEHGELGEALAAVRASVRARPLEPEPRLARGRVLEMAGRPARAAAEYRRVVRLTPTDVECYCSLAGALEAAGAGERARVVLESARERFPAETQSFVALARLAGSANRWQEAIDLLKSGLAIAPDDAALLLQLGEAYYAVTDFDRAVVFATRARRHASERTRALDLLGRAFLARGEVKRALDLAATLLAEKADDPRGLVLRGRASLVADNPGAAARDLQRYVRACPGDAAGYRDLARALQGLGQEEAAAAQSRLAEYVAGAR